MLLLLVYVCAFSGPNKQKTMKKSDVRVLCPLALLLQHDTRPSWSRRESMRHALHFNTRHVPSSLQHFILVSPYSFLSSIMYFQQSIYVSCIYSIHMYLSIGSWSPCNCGCCVASIAYYVLLYTLCIFYELYWIPSLLLSELSIVISHNTNTRLYT